MAHFCIPARCRRGLKYPKLIKPCLQQASILELLLKFYNVGLQTPKSCCEAKSMSRILAISKNFLRRDRHYKNAPEVLRPRYVKEACA